jgi:hypothetical protein
MIGTPLIYIYIYFVIVGNGLQKEIYIIIPSKWHKTHDPHRISKKYWAAINIFILMSEHSTQQC